MKIFPAQTSLRMVLSPWKTTNCFKHILKLYSSGVRIAASSGLILVDTKYEFGKVGGQIFLIDEIHTPDSSRYFYTEGYQERQASGTAQKQLSKEFVRKWLIENGFHGQEGQVIPEMTPEIILSISERYIELYEQITGDEFVKNETDEVSSRIESNINECLKSLS